MQKVISSFLLFIIGLSLASSLILFYPQRTYAFWGVLDVNGETVTTIIEVIKDLASTYFRKMVLDRIVDQIVNWISTGEEPKFITDWEGFLTDTADQAAGQWLNDLVGPQIMGALCQPNWAVKIRISLEKPPTFFTRVQCTPSLIGKNFNDFMANFNNGGWKNWIKVTESQNNPYGLYLMALDDKLDKEIKKQTGAQGEIQSGGGFLSDKVCTECKSCVDLAEGGELVPLIYEGMTEYTCNSTPCYYTKEELNELGGEEYILCNKWSTRTPGRMLADLTAKSVSKDAEWLQKNEKWASYIVAITDALINRMVKEGVAAVTKPNTESYASADVTEAYSNLTTQIVDTTPPSTALKVKDANHVIIQVTSNEPAGTAPTIFYSIDGSQPTDDVLGNSLVYHEPLEITKYTVLKWFAKDSEGNKETTKTQILRPPFLVTSLKAVAENQVALVSNIPNTTIYYTLDNTQPTAFSPQYIQPINLTPNVPTTIKWFGVDSNLHQEMSVNTLTITAPLGLGSEVVYDPSAVDPVAAIDVANVNVSKNAYFYLDPNGSFDPSPNALIVMYEWDFDGDGEYDWRLEDVDKDGNIDHYICRVGAVCGDPADGFTNGLSGIQPDLNVKTTKIVNIKFNLSGEKTIGLRVTNADGFTNEISLDIIVN